MPHGTEQACIDGPVDWRGYVGVLLLWLRYRSYPGETMLPIL